MSRYGAWERPHTIGRYGHRNHRLYHGGYVREQHYTDDHIVWVAVYGLSGSVRHYVAWDAWNPTIRARSKTEMQAAVDAVRALREWHREASVPDGWEDHVGVSA